MIENEDLLRRIEEANANPIALDKVSKQIQKLFYGAKLMV